MGHYRMKKQQFDMALQDIDQEKKKLASIVAEKQAWEKWDNSTPRVMEKTVKELEQMGKDFDREFGTRRRNQNNNRHHRNSHSSSNKNNNNQKTSANR
jgi:hypothetical protein